MDIVIRIITLLASFFAVMVVLSFHEFAHAFVAYKCGDPTAKINGRCSLNPMVHFDLLGLIMFTFAGFGWAKPVPINPLNFNHYRRGLTLTAIAGVVMNLIMAFLLFPIYKLVVLYVNIPLWPIQTFVEMLFMLLWTYSISFCVFNLIPLAPLDGWRVVEALNRRHGRVYRFFERYGSIILLILIAIHFVSGYFTVLGYIDILGYILDFAVNIVAWPITAFWGLIF
ncbi:MAG: site-2 protease family protein [Candidatus Borkfalkia sp.]|uniref:site-2 protease family protein n=1 Tax=Candidatus Borkfalkia ceftriaxoniphila TaxID=2508949 RepID=UPI00138709EE|nr:site-2 protease family protein [Candidatus Borkfalkia ceftriaxoniphila]